VKEDRDVKHVCTFQILIYNIRRSAFTASSLYANINNYTVVHKLVSNSSTLLSRCHQFYNSYAVF
jgi:hypothetical protein